MTPFFYFEITTRLPGGRPSFDLLVKCANKGYGHRHDPVIARAMNAQSIDEGLREIRALIPDAPILGPEEYIAEMARRSLQGNGSSGETD